MSGRAVRLHLLPSQGAGELSNLQAGQVPSCLTSFPAALQVSWLAGRRVRWCLPPKQVVPFLLSECFYYSVQGRKISKLAETVLCGNPLILLALLSV